MNREQRRKQEKMLRHKGYSRVAAKSFVDTYYRADKFVVGQRCKFKYEEIIRHPDFENQEDGFRAWIEDHKDTILTVKQVKNGDLVTFVEDDQEEPYWHHVETIKPVLVGKVKLDDGTETEIGLEV